MHGRLGFTQTPEDGRSPLPNPSRRVKPGDEAENLPQPAVLMPGLVVVPVSLLVLVPLLVPVPVVVVVPVPVVVAAVRRIDGGNPPGPVSGGWLA